MFIIPLQKIISLAESELYDMLILLRNTRDTPLHCSCEGCVKRRALEKVRILFQFLSEFQIPSHVTLWERESLVGDEW